MKLHLTITVCAAALFPDSAVSHADTGSHVPFLENVGQIENDDVGYYVKLASGSMFVTTDGELVYSFSCRANGAEADGEDGLGRWALRETFLGGHPAAPRGADPSPILVSHFKGPRPEAWRSRLPAFERVRLGEVYPGIRVELLAAGDNVEKLIHVAPRADLDALQIAVEGVDALSVNDEGELVLETVRGDVAFTAPEAYQRIDGERRIVEARYVLADGAYGFTLGEHDRDHEVVIDPLLASTFLGGHNPNPPGNYDDDIVQAMATVGGMVYVAGATQSPDFPVKMGYDESLSSAFPDCFVTLMTGDLQSVVASTFLGNTSSDRVEDIAIDARGSVVITGQASYGFPVTPGAYTYDGTTFVGGGFVARLSPDLSTLQASAVPTPSDFPRVLAAADGAYYFGGSTTDKGFPITPGAYQSTCCPVTGGFGIPSSDGFVGRISADLTTLEALTYVSGDIILGMAVAPDGTVFVANGFDHAITGFVARFDAGLTTLLGYLSYYPGSTSGSSRTYFNDVAVVDDMVVVVGQTYMNDLPATPGAFDPTCGTDGLCDGVGPLLVPHSDGFVAMYSLDLQTTLALTYLGGSDHESIRALAIAPDHSIVVTGETTSVDFPTTAGAHDRWCGMDGACDPTGPFAPTPDAFVARLSADLSWLQYGTYLGGSGEELPFDVVVDEAGHVLVGGMTRSANFPVTQGAFDETYNGGTSDAFISKFGFLHLRDPRELPGPSVVK